MTQVLHLLGQVPRGVWTAVVTAIVMALLARAASRRTSRDADGWTPLQATIGMQAMSVFGLFLVLFFVAASLIAVGAMIQSGGPDRPMMLLLAIAPPLAVMIGYGSLYTFFVRFRFNDEGCERTGYGQRRFVVWSDVARIHRHPIFGLVLKETSGRWFMLPEYHRGFAQLIERAAASGAPVELD